MVDYHPRHRLAGYAQSTCTYTASQPKQAGFPMYYIVGIREGPVLNIRGLASIVTF